MDWAWAFIAGHRVLGLAARYTAVRGGSVYAARARLGAGAARFGARTPGSPRLHHAVNGTRMGVALPEFTCVLALLATVLYVARNSAITLLRSGAA